ncbi:MAG: hypothetical protein JOZ80_18575 [Acidobacteriaceae bacterium]|nr:hypothetical protein [Acidobacteriaceae bacterium]
MMLGFAFAGAERKPSPEFLSLFANPIVWSIIGFGAGIYLFIRGFALLRRKRFIENVPRSTIRGASLGLIEVSGKVEGPYTIIAPLSEEDCFYYRTIAWTGGSERRWRKAAEESLSAPFFLHDGTGKLMVDARGARSELEPVFSEEYETSPPLYAQHFLNRHGVSPGVPVKLEEVAVRAGQTLFAMGTLREYKPEDSPSTQFLSAEAADLQREEEIGGVILPGSMVTQQKTVPTKEFDLHPKVVLGSSPSRPLFLSPRSQIEIVQDLAWKSAVYIWGGPALTLFCFWYLLSRLGAL